MDQAKFRLPKLTSRPSKAMEVLYRPTLHVVGCWFQGARLGFYISNEEVRKDSCTQLEVIFRSLSDLVQEHGQLPLTFHLQQDNCYREGKNQFVASAMILLVACKVFRATTLGYLRSGHSRWSPLRSFKQAFHLQENAVLEYSPARNEALKMRSAGHEDIDQAFGQLASMICTSSFETPEALVDLINGGAGTRKRHRLRSQHVFAQQMDEVARWKDWTAQLGIKIKGMSSLTSSISTFHQLRTSSLLPIPCAARSCIGDLRPCGTSRGFSEQVSEVRRGHHDVHKALAGRQARIYRDGAGAGRAGPGHSQWLCTSCRCVDQAPHHGEGVQAA